MSWGTDFTADLYLNHIIVKTAQEALDKIEDLIKENNEIETTIKMMAVARPKDLLTEPGQDLVATISYELDAYLEDYRDNVQNILLLNAFITSLHKSENDD